MGRQMTDNIPQLFVILALRSFMFYVSGGQGECAWRMALCAQRQTQYSLCALRFALCVESPAKAFHYYNLCKFV
jgi:hypothetical protein